MGRPLKNRGLSQIVDEGLQPIRQAAADYWLGRLPGGGAVRPRLDELRRLSLRGIGWSRCTVLLDNRFLCRRIAAKPRRGALDHVDAITSHQAPL
jgi:hypothetical protein